MSGVPRLLLAPTLTTPIGIVPLIGREQLAYARFGDAPLFMAAVGALHRAIDSTVHLLVGSARAASAQRDAQVGSYDAVTVPEVFELVREAAERDSPIAIHDPLCPLLSSGFLADLVSRASLGETVVGVRPVIDTVKAVRDGAIVRTLDRDAWRSVASPVALPARRLLELSKVTDLAGTLLRHDVLVLALREVGPVTLVPAPAASLRVHDSSSLALLRGFDAVGHRIRER